MTALQVSSVVDSILAAFTNGMDIFSRTKGRASRKRKIPASVAQQELRIHDSLSNRPKQINAEYTRSVRRHGKQFEQGDEMAYSTLASTLLVLNTGLIHLINDALSSDAMGKSRSRQSLLTLSESAAIDTMYALNQLDARLSASRGLHLALCQKSGRPDPAKKAENSPSIQRPPPSPLLARGGWVRSRSGSSVVSAAAAKKLAAPDSGRSSGKLSSTNSKSITLPQSSALSPPKLVQNDHRHDVYLNESTIELAGDSGHVVAPSFDFQSTMKRQPSMLLVSADFFNSRDEVGSDLHVPPRPPKIPLHVRPNPRAGPRPISAATFMTASTKIGEIPEHKWTDRVLVEEREQGPLPYVIPPPLQPPKVRSRGLRLWKRPEKKETVVVC